MDQQTGRQVDVDGEGATDELSIEEASREHLGQWNRLVSTTNWEKGRIILSWRQALVAAGAPPGAFSDEAWSRRVGNVSPQHVGRLRRVYERFSAVRNGFAGLYWSHFQAALDWDDAEMWLEGAVQNRWSVAEMRQRRGEVLGVPADQVARDEELARRELDEDDTPDEAPRSALGIDTVRDVPAGPDYSQGPDFGDEPEETSAAVAVPFDAGGPRGEAHGEQRAAVFENLPPLPDDLADAVEAFKLAIVRHRLSGWSEVDCSAVLDALEALRQLALAPADVEA